MAEIGCPQAVSLEIQGTDFSNGMYTGDEGLSWFDPGDPFANALSLMVARHGEDWCGTVFYAGMPVLVVFAGGSMGDQQFETETPTYLEPSRQEIHALFYEHVLGTLPTEGEEDTVRSESWPFPHDAANMVHHRMTPEDCSKYLDNPPIGDHAPYYDLYAHLLPEAEGEGHEFVAFVGCVARSMVRALRHEDPAFEEGGEAHAALRGF